MFHEGYSVDKVHELSKIDKWFLYKLQNIVDMTHELEGIGSLFGLKKEIILKAKKMGFSDKQIAKAVHSTEDEVRARRKSFGIRPWVKKIDTLAAEFPADTNYLYTTYNASSHDVTFDDHGIMVLGSGVYRIGSSVEFDWCAVNATLSLNKLGKKTVMINCKSRFPSTCMKCAVLLCARSAVLTVERSSATNDSWIQIHDRGEYTPASIGQLTPCQLGLHSPRSHF
jgi:carbamoyl-phosphate synthase large subunit